MPRTRPCIQRALRFIPTCVGQIVEIGVALLSSLGSSPHAWGRSPAARSHVRNFSGSSPHAWGRLPAKAREDIALPVHPHMRGADDRKGVRCRRRRTVHPHMRGADAWRLGVLPGWPRFIPTCVGQIIFSQRSLYGMGGSSPHAWGRCRLLLFGRRCRPVHPHMRGADTNQPRKRQAANAVHPHMRGADHSRRA